MGSVGQATAGQAGDSAAFVVRFWGVRGSYPVTTAAMQGVGGNTACVEVQAGGREIIFDAGTGLIALGQELLRRAEGAPVTATLLVSHFHHDHLLGLPFFAPLYQPGTTLLLAGLRVGGREIGATLHAMFRAPYFPVDLYAVPSACQFAALETGARLVWQPGQHMPAQGIAPAEEQPLAQRMTPSQEKRMPVALPGVVEVRCLHTEAHPRDGCLVFRVEYAGHSVVYATDVEEGAEGDALMVEFARGADVLIHDAQYTEEEYHTSRRGFGHSTVAMAVALARAAGVRQLVLFHHDPEHDDALLERMCEEARAAFPATRLAVEGLAVRLC